MATPSTHGPNITPLPRIIAVPAPWSTSSVIKRESYYNNNCQFCLLCACASNKDIDCYILAWNCNKLMTKVMVQFSFKTIYMNQPSLYADTYPIRIFLTQFQNFIKSLGYEYREHVFMICTLAVCRVLKLLLLH